ncbi:hypothetical protein KAJ61_04550 [Candidatus Parcubacteria bacterium]|nr:hypothetical protein [Candidatus Parcubacteria bacterium]
MEKLGITIKANAPLYLLKEMVRKSNDTWKDYWKLIEGIDGNSYIENLWSCSSVDNIWNDTTKMKFGLPEISEQERKDILLTPCIRAAEYITDPKQNWSAEATVICDLFGKPLQPYLITEEKTSYQKKYLLGIFAAPEIISVTYNNSPMSFELTKEKWSNRFLLICKYNIRLEGLAEINSKLLFNKRNVKEERFLSSAEIINRFENVLPAEFKCFNAAVEAAVLKSEFPMNLFQTS